MHCIVRYASTRKRIVAKHDKKDNLVLAVEYAVQYPCHICQQKISRDMQ